MEDDGCSTEPPSNYRNLWTQPDVGADPTIGVASARGNLTYYQGNGVLPTAEGHRIIAPIVAAAIKTL